MAFTPSKEGETGDVATTCVIKCDHCGQGINPSGRGRRRRFCSDACRMKAYRAKRRLLAYVMRGAGMGEYVTKRWRDYRTPFPL